MFNLRQSQSNLFALSQSKNLPHALPVLQREDEEGIPVYHMADLKNWLDYVGLKKNDVPDLLKEFPKMANYAASRLFVLSKYGHLKFGKFSVEEFREIVNVIYKIIPLLLADFVRMYPSYLDSPGELITLFLSDAIVGGVEEEIREILGVKFCRENNMFENGAASLSARLLFGEDGRKLSFGQSVVSGEVEVPMFESSNNSSADDHVVPEENGEASGGLELRDFERENGQENILMEACGFDDDLSHEVWKFFYCENNVSLENFVFVFRTLVEREIFTKEEVEMRFLRENPSFFLKLLTDAQILKLERDLIVFKPSKIKKNILSRLKKFLIKVDFDAKKLEIVSNNFEVDQSNEVVVPSSEAVLDFDTVSNSSNGVYLA